MLARKYLPEYTYQDYEGWEGRWELIEGIPYAMSPAPNPKHQRINGRLFRFFDEALDDCQDCQTSFAIDWKLANTTVIQPDLLIVYQPISGQYLDFPPELVVEILSPSTAHKDRNLKYELYQDQGVAYYLIVNPVEIYEWKAKNYVPVKVMKKGDADASYSFSLKNCKATVNFEKIW